MTDENSNRDKAPSVLIEGPRCGDAKLFGGWLLAADKANRLWQLAAKDSTFKKQVERLEVMYVVDLGLAALALVLELRENFVAFVIRLDSELAELFVIMAEMGFFVLTGQRYQMVVPSRLTIADVKRAFLRLAQTEDAEYYLHPEHLVTSMSFVDAKGWQRCLGAIGDDHRDADRMLLLGDDSVVIHVQTPRQPSGRNSGRRIAIDSNKQRTRPEPQFLQSL